MSDPFLGEIRMFGGNYAPRGWAFCKGDLLSISQFDALFGLLGTIYGGDGVSNFALPDLQGRMPIHRGTSYSIGQIGGQEAVTLVTNNLPMHTHQAQGQTANGTQASPANAVWASSSLNEYVNTAPDSNMNQKAIGYIGDSNPHENMMPFLTLSFIICLEGIYPPQS
jgi:microcystin-dependent protein